MGSLLPSLPTRAGWRCQRHSSFTFALPLGFASALGYFSASLSCCCRLVWVVLHLVLVERCRWWLLALDRNLRHRRGQSSPSSPNDNVMFETMHSALPRPAWSEVAPVPGVRLDWVPSQARGSIRPPGFATRCQPLRCYPQA
jgi:hypothetical protein